MFLYDLFVSKLVLWFSVASQYTFMLYLISKWGIHKVPIGISCLFTSDHRTIFCAIWILKLAFKAWVVENKNRFTPTLNPNKIFAFFLRQLKIPLGFE